MADSIYTFDPVAANNTALDTIPYGPNQLYHNQIDNWFRSLAAKLAQRVDDLGGVNTVGGTANAITVTIASGITAYATGQVFWFKNTVGPNSAATFINVNAIGSKEIRLQGDTALSGGEMLDNGYYGLLYDEAYDGASGGFVLLNPEVSTSITFATNAQAAAGTSTDLSVNPVNLAYILAANQAQIGFYQAKSQSGFTGYRRGVNTLWDGFADSSGVNAGRSSNYSVDTSGKKIAPTPVGGATGSYRASYIDTSDATTYTFAGSDIGTAAADRIVVVAVSGVRSGGLTVSSLTIGGVSATKLGGQASGNYVTEMWAAAVTTGTTASIVVNWSGTAIRGAIGVWATYGASITPHDTGVSTASPLTDSLNVEAGGLLFGTAFDSNVTTLTWSGLTEDFDIQPEAGYAHSGASLASATAQTVAISATIASPSATRGAVFVSLSPTVAPAVGNMTYSTTLQTADAAVTSVTAYFEIDEIDAVTLGTDLTVNATCNGWSNTGAATLTDMGAGQSGRTLVRAVATGLTSGTSFGVDVVFANNTEAPVYGMEVKAA